jgi:hypothetical protein
MVPQVALLLILAAKATKGATRVGSMARPFDPGHAICPVGQTGYSNRQRGPDQ